MTKSTLKIKGPCRPDSNFQKGETIKLFDDGKVLATLTQEGRKHAPFIVEAVNAAPETAADRDLLLVAIRKIADLNEGNCEKYVKKADSIAVEALVRLSHHSEDRDDEFQKLQAINAELVAALKKMERAITRCFEPTSEEMKNLFEEARAALKKAGIE